MAIPETQLQTWARYVEAKNAQHAHHSIRNALDSAEWPDNAEFEVYLQGSYRNDTNIRGDSDVDIVVQLNSAFCSNLSEVQNRVFGFTAATYGWNEFRADVLRGLRKYYGWDRVREGRKSLKVQTPYLPADVVVCIQYRKYRLPPRNANDYVEGMTFYVPSENRWVINYPKLHYDNGVEKNKRTNGWYKPTVRLFKNARTCLVDRKIIPSDLAPSYFLECLLYNVPDGMFGGSFQDTFCNVVNWLSGANLSQFVCQNEQLPLFGDSPEQWSQSKARQFVRAMIDLWNHWG